MHGVAQDLKVAVRTLLRNPGFAAAVVLTLALGIGANTAIFSVVRGVLLRPLPYGEPDRLVRIFSSWRQFPRGAVSAPEYRDYRRELRHISPIAAWAFGEGNLSDGGASEHLLIGRCTASLLPVLGLLPALGRWFSEGEEQPGQDRVAVLTHALWKRRYGGDPSTVGRAVLIDGQPYRIVGVLPDVALPASFDLWVPLALRPDQLSETARPAHFLRTVGRIAPGSTIGRAQAELDLLAGRLRAEHPAVYAPGAGFGISAVPLLDQIVGEVRPNLWMLIAAVGLVLLLACANAANLLLAQATVRQRELAVRAALGAGRARLVRQLLVESLVLAIVAGTLGVLLAIWGLDLLLALGPSDLPRAGEVRIDALVLGFAMAASLSTGAVFGLFPALSASLVDLQGSLHGGSSAGAAPHPRRLRRGLVAAQVAVALVLLAGAGLLLRSFTQVLRVDPGFRPDEVLTLRVALPRSAAAQPQAEDARYRAFFDEALEKLRSLPGVSAAGAVDFLPLSGVANDATFQVEGDPTAPGAPRPDEEVRVVLPGYFEALGIRLLRGRTIADADRGAATPAIVVNQALARRYFQDEDPLGRRLLIDSAGAWTIVGVVADVHEFGLDAQAKPQMYLPYHQLPGAGRSMTVVLRGSVPEGRLIAPARDALAALDQQQAVFDVRPMREMLAGSLERRRFALVLVESFAALALLLSALGLYGVMAYTVAQRRHEFGVRMALGATGAQVLRLVARESTAVVGVGLGVGLGGALIAGRLVSGLLFAVNATDPASLAGGAAVLVAACALASWLPARRATRVDPMVALRSE